MTPIEAETLEAALASLRDRLASAEQTAASQQLRAGKAEAERDALRVLLSRSRTSLVESFNDSAAGH